MHAAGRTARGEEELPKYAVGGIFLCDLDGLEGLDGQRKAKSTSPPPETSVISQPNRLDVRAIILFTNFAVNVIRSRFYY